MLDRSCGSERSAEARKTDEGVVSLSACSEGTNTPMTKQSVDQCWRRVALVGTSRWRHQRETAAVQSQSARLVKGVDVREANEMIVPLAERSTEPLPWLTGIVVIVD